MNRRRVLALAAGGTLGVSAGCLDIAPTTVEDHELKPDSWDDHCPSASNLDLDWPDELDSASVRTFMDEHIHQIIGQSHHDHSQLWGYTGSITHHASSAAGDGYEGEMEGWLASLMPSIEIVATKLDDSGDTALVDVSAIDSEEIRGLIETAAETNTANLTSRDLDQYEPDEVMAIFESASNEFQMPTEFDESEALNVTVGDTVVKIEVWLRNPGLLDGSYEADYYIDDRGLVIDSTTLDSELTIIECRGE